MILNTFITQLKIEVDKNYFSHLEVNGFASNYTIDNKNIDKVYSDFIRKYTFLTNSQLINLNRFFETLQYVVPLIHPDKIEMNDCIHEDQDLMFWKESPSGFSEIILHDDGDVSCYFIGKTSNNREKTLFQSNEIDFESILYKFLSR